MYHIPFDITTNNTVLYLYDVFLILINGKAGQYVLI
jgi:hypothetical protein